MAYTYTSNFAYYIFIPRMQVKIRKINTLYQDRFSKYLFFTEQEITHERIIDM